MTEEMTRPGNVGSARRNVSDCLVLEVQGEVELALSLSSRYRAEACESPESNYFQEDRELVDVESKGLLRS